MDQVIAEQVIAAAEELRGLLEAAKEKYGMDTPLPAEVLQAILEAQDRHQKLWDAHFGA